MQDLAGLIEQNRRRCMATLRILRLRPGQRRREDGMRAWNVYLRTSSYTPPIKSRIRRRGFFSGHNGIITEQQEQPGQREQLREHREQSLLLLSSLLSHVFCDVFYDVFCDAS
jgi:hypothetical protein